MRSFSSRLAHLSPRIVLSIALASAPSLVACGGGGASVGQDAPKASLRRFGSETELSTYLDQIADESARGGSSSGGTASPSAESAGSASDSSGAAPPSNENVTNNQEAGVDEGGIVKNVGDALVVLRKGRLYAVSIAQPGAPQQTDSVAVAPAPELNQNVWYDEMLVKGDLVYVVGYRYGLQLEGATNDGYGYRGATEVSSFRLTAGKLERLKVAYFESNDYFSGSNYASRMIDGTLAFYMPRGVWSYASANRTLHIPRRLEPTSGGKFTEGAPLFAPTDVYVPLDLPKSPVFHTIVKCALPADGSFSCQARALLSNWGREHYVTKDAVFLWSLPRAYMFRFEDLGVTAHRSLVAPRDQFSFALREGKLHVAGVAVDPSALENGYGYGYGYGSSANGKIVVESLPTADFDVFGEQDLATKSREVASLGQGSAWVNKNRFVGGALFLGLTRYESGPSYDDGSYGGGTSSTKLLRVDLASGAVDTRDVAGQVSRIEPMGETRALVATATQGGLALEPIPTTGPLAPTAVEQLAGVSEGESRSHGFFFKPDAPGANGGLFGLPVLNANANGGWGGGISNVGFWRVTEAGGLEKRGIVSSSNAEGVCETSCVDWYGNTRPVFLKDRAFALMGSELAEITLVPSASRLGQAAILGN